MTNRLIAHEVIERADQGKMNEYLGADGRSWLAMTPEALEEWPVGAIRRRTWRVPPAEDNLYYDQCTGSIVVKLTPPVESVLIARNLINTHKLRTLRRTA